MYKVEKGKAFYWTIKTLHIIFAIPVSFKESYLKKFYLKNVVVRFLASFFLAVLPSYHLISSVMDHTGVDISEDISMILGGMGTVATNTFMAFRYKWWSKFFTDLEKCNKLFGKPSTMEKQVKALNSYSLAYIIYTYMGQITYGVVAASKWSDCKKLNEEKGMHEICGAFLPLKLPFIVETPLATAAIFAAQFFSTIFSIPTGGVICFMVLEVTEVVICYYKQLCIHLEEVFDVPDEEERRERLGFCIRYHNHMLGLTRRLQTMVKYTTGHLSLISAIVFGTFGNQALKSKPLGALIFLVGYVIALFSLCRAGQRLMDETQSVSDAAYNSKWYNADPKTTKNLVFIIARSQEPEVLDALPLGSFSYPLFLLIVKTSYTYLTLLQQTT
nr:odorant receptor 12 [Monochamus saltuarius]